MVKARPGFEGRKGEDRHKGSGKEMEEKFKTASVEGTAEAGRIYNTRR